MQALNWQYSFGNTLVNAVLFFGLALSGHACSARALKTSRAGGAPAAKPGRGTVAGRGGGAERAAPAACVGGCERAEGEPDLTNEQIRRLMMSSSDGGESQSAESK